MENTNESDNSIICINCNSQQIIKDGRRQTTSGFKQKFLCLQCNKRFVINPVGKIKGNLEVVCFCIDLYMKGVSYRGIQDTVKQFYGIKVNHVTIMRWIHDFMETVNSYLEDQHPEVGKTWMADEQVVKVKGKVRYIFNCMDTRTRFLLASKFSKNRTTKDARALFKEAKRTADDKALKVITDGYVGYYKAVRKEFASYENPKPHKRYVSIRQPTGSNNRLERYHSSFRQRDKVMRGFKTRKGVDKYRENFRTYYNFVRKHQGLGVTPAQAGGLLIPADWQKLLAEALSADKQQSQSNS